MEILRTAAAVGLLLGGLLAAFFLGGCDSSARRREATPTAAADRRRAGTDIPSISAGSLSEEMVGRTVQVTGEVVEQCPASGCWLKIKGSDGETFVDLIPSPLRLSENRVGQEARATGEVVQRGSDLAIKAQQVEFGPSPQNAPEGENEGSHACLRWTRSTTG